MPPENVGRHMTTYPFIASGKTYVAEAKKFMQETNIRHMPVIESDRVVGIVSLRDLDRALAQQPDGHKATVDEVMTRDPYTVRSSEPLARVAETMAKKKYGSAVVINDRGKVMGIFTTIDALHVLSQILSESPEMEYNKYGIERFMPPMLDAM